LRDVDIGGRIVDPKEIGYEHVKRIELAQDRVSVDFCDDDDGHSGFLAVGNI
jgi:hypothetical protein